ncbi:hypothetical protein DL771_007503 [Monosporascus sp. 5C6A]|nr:hypothetical protein DL771_007503 [Monosporascus sp. 5C6A]
MASARVCRLSQPRMLDHILKGALASGFLQPALGRMLFRPTVRDCHGTAGVNTRDWIGFATEAKGRLAMDPCPGTKNVSTWQKPQSTPHTSPASVVFCAACYHNEMHHTAEEPKWRRADELARAARQQAGVTNSTWCTLPADPPGFHICRTCYLATGPRALLQAQTPTSPSSPGNRKNKNFPAVLCCFNQAHPRLRKGFRLGLMEAYLTRDARALDDNVVGVQGHPALSARGGRHEQALVRVARLHDLPGVLARVHAAPAAAGSARRAARPGPGDEHHRQQQFLNIGSSHYNNSGKIQKITMPSAYKYSQQTLGTFANSDLLHGAQYGAQGRGHLGEGVGVRRCCWTAGEAVEGC